MHKELGDYLFEGCTSLVSATLPAVGGFGDFKGRTWLYEVTVGGVTFYASDSDEDYLSYVVMAVRSDIVDIRDGVIYGFTKRAMSAIYGWMADQERHHEREYGCAVLLEGYRCTAYLGRCSQIGIIPKDAHVRAIAPRAFSGISNLMAFVAPETASRSTGAPSPERSTSPLSWDVRAMSAPTGGNARRHRAHPRHQESNDLSP